MLLCKTIIMTYPSMANLADTEGNLPVHILAERCVQYKVFYCLLKVFYWMMFFFNDYC